jgi:hypothetical protein
MKQVAVWKLVDKAPTHGFKEGRPEFVDHQIKARGRK